MINNCEQRDEIIDTIAESERFWARRPGAITTPTLGPERFEDAFVGNAASFCGQISNKKNRRRISFRDDA